MGLGTALTVAVSGLRANQNQLDVVSNNIANAETPGFTKKSVTLVSAISGDRGAGVRAGEISRALDIVVQRQMRTEGAAAQFTSIRSDIMSKITDLFGSPGSDSSFDAIFNKFTGAFQALATSPDAYSAQRNVLNEAQVLAQTLNQLTSDVQSLRTDMERKLADATRRANVALKGIETVTRQLEAAGNTGSAALLDQRDGYINDLSQLMDIRVVQSGNELAVYTNSGISLFTGRAGIFSFDERAFLDANALHSSTEASGTGTLTFVSADGVSLDMFSSTYIRSGEFAAYREMRDVFLPQFQNRLDALAGSLASALSNETIAGTAVTDGFSIDTTRLKVGNPLTINYTDASGNDQVLTVINAEDAAVLPYSDDVTARSDDSVLGVVFSDGITSAASAIQTAMGAGFTVTGSGSTLTIIRNGSDADAVVGSVSQEVTNTSYADNGYGIPLYTDGSTGVAYTNAISGVPQERGFAGRISVNKELFDVPSRLVKYSTSPATLAGDSNRPTELYNRITLQTQTYSPSTGIGGTSDPFEGTPQNFMRNIIDITSFEQQSASRIDEGQQIVVTSLSARFQESSAVNVDREMADLMLIQNSFAASARVMNVIKEMLDRLMSI